MIPPGEKKCFPVAGDAPKPTKAITCFLTLTPAHRFIPHLISEYQTPLATSWFLLSHQHNDVGQEWAWLSRDDPPPIMAKEAAVPQWVQLVHSTCLHLFVLCKLNAILWEFPSQGLSVLSHPLTSDGATATHQRCSDDGPQGAGGSSGPLNSRPPPPSRLQALPTKEYVRRTCPHSPDTLFLTPGPYVSTSRSPYNSKQRKFAQGGKVESLLIQPPSSGLRDQNHLD